ncbi:small multidrug efflux protein [Frigoribacterium sp. PvP032]|uniref:small multidrug efflux protein n=1 Tax=Frigoribacterium sp. PvP032 TaxID=2806589 RepID=UPI001AE9F751|nr:small multidrug efflux protein [Frigoribacterium sp. PvP032]MBP1191082.1 hypothetical protein [Frigoribacterium sp. PvP032]
MSRIVLTASSAASDPGGPFAWFQELVGQVPEAVQPLVVALAAAVPFVEGELGAVLGIIGGLHPVVAALAAFTGNLLCVVLVVLLGSRIREALVRRRAARGLQTVGESRSGSTVPAASEVATTVPANVGGSTRFAGFAGAGASTPAPVAAAAASASASVDTAEAVPENKGKAKLRRWLVKFGVPGASLLAPLALPTMFTAASFVASGVPKGWVILWQAVAIAAWTTLTTLIATGILSAIG